jgi:hypothetical protein
MQRFLCKDFYAKIFMQRFLCKDFYAKIFMQRFLCKDFYVNEKNNQRNTIYWD